MKKTSLYKLSADFFISLCLFLILCAPVCAKVTIVSLVPSITEIIFALGLEDALIGVSDRCNYPLEAKEKEKIGSLYGINKEKIIRLKPDYVLALKTAEPFLTELKGLNTKFMYFEFNSVSDILNAISTIGSEFGAKKQADKLTADIKASIKPTATRKTILYVVQSQPLITIGSESFLTDVIRLSGNISATADIKGQYPSISIEHGVRLKPDIIVLGPYADIGHLKPFFTNKNTKFYTMTNEENDLVNRPSARVGAAIGFFSALK